MRVLVFDYDKGVNCDDILGHLDLDVGSLFESINSWGVNRVFDLVIPDK